MKFKATEDTMRVLDLNDVRQDFEMNEIVEKMMLFLSR
jgi:hypothetical protein